MLWRRLARRPGVSSKGESDSRPSPPFGGLKRLGVDAPSPPIVSRARRNSASRSGDAGPPSSESSNWQPESGRLLRGGTPGQRRAGSMDARGGPLRGRWVRSGLATSTNLAKTCCSAVESSRELSCELPRVECGWELPRLEPLKRRPRESRDSRPPPGDGDALRGGGSRLKERGRSQRAAHNETQGHLSSFIDAGINARCQRL